MLKQFETIPFLRLIRFSGALGLVKADSFFRCFTNTSADSFRPISPLSSSLPRWGVYIFNMLKSTYGILAEGPVRSCTFTSM